MRTEEEQRLVDVIRKKKLVHDRKSMHYLLFVLS